MLSIGIVGLPNVGKSTLFNALVKGHQAQVADYPFTTIEPNVGMVEVPDARLTKIAEILKLPKKIPATIKFIDIAGLVKNAHKGEGLGNQFLSHIREVDVIIHVLDGFSGKSDPEDAKETINIELGLADIKKPTIYVLNVKESDLKKTKRMFLDEGRGDAPNEAAVGAKRNRMAREPESEERPEAERKNTIILSAKMEEELIDLPENEQKEYLNSYNLKESGLNRLIEKSYQLLNLISFYTLIPEKQIQAWPISAGTSAQKAAGLIHSDFEKGFIKAEVIKYDDLTSAGSLSRAKDMGKVNIQGKDYIVKDSDLIQFKFRKP